MYTRPSGNTPTRHSHLTTLVPTSEPPPRRRLVRCRLARALRVQRSVPSARRSPTSGVRTDVASRASRCALLPSGLDTEGATRVAYGPTRLRRERAGGAVVLMLRSGDTRRASSTTLGNTQARGNARTVDLHVNLNAKPSVGFDGETSAYERSDALLNRHSASLGLLERGGIGAMERVASNALLPVLQSFSPHERDCASSRTGSREHQRATAAEVVGQEAKLNRPYDRTKKGAPHALHCRLPRLVWHAPAREPQDEQSRRVGNDADDGGRRECDKLDEDAHPFAIRR